VVSKVCDDLGTVRQDLDLDIGLCIYKQICNFSGNESFSKNSSAIFIEIEVNAEKKILSSQD
jgi:hypothetical protein